MVVKILSCGNLNKVFFKEIFMSSNSLKHDEQRNVSPGVRGLHENVRGNFSNLWPGSDVSNLVGDVSGLYGMVFQDLCGCATGKNVNVSRLRSINLGDIAVNPQTREVVVLEPIYPFPPGSRI